MVRKKNLMKKLASMFICLVIVFALVFPVSAKETPSIVQKITVSDLPFVSVNNKENMSVLSDELQQIVLSASKDGEDWTFGFLAPKNGTLTYNDVKNRLEQELTIMNTVHSFTVKDFWIGYYQVSGSESYMSELNCVENIYVETSDVDVALESTVGSTTLPKLFSETLSSDVSSYPIDGSHYFQRAVGGVTQYLWYNQITGLNSVIYPTAVSPYAGDGNNRTDSGYPWFPYYISLQTRQVGQWGRTYVVLQFKFTEENLRNLNYDDNEALEMEVDFYNYARDEDIKDKHGNIIESDRGVSFVPVRGNPIQYIEDGYDYDNPFIWYVNMGLKDVAYLDTAFEDNITTISSCVGISDTSVLEANRQYEWTIAYSGMALKCGNANDGRFNVVAQRSYVANLPLTMPFRVFSEEKEQMVRYGIDSSRHWVGADKNAFDNQIFTCDLSNGGIWSQKESDE